MTVFVQTRTADGCWGGGGEGGGQTNLWVLENLVFFTPLLKEDLVLAVPRPGQQRLHHVLVVLEGPF